MSSTSAIGAFFVKLVEPRALASIASARLVETVLSLNPPIDMASESWAPADGGRRY